MNSHKLNSLHKFVLALMLTFFSVYATGVLDYVSSCENCMIEYSSECEWEEMDALECYGDENPESSFINSKEFNYILSSKNWKTKSSAPLTPPPKA